MEENKEKERIIRKLRQRGSRMTKQRQVILDVIFDCGFESCKDICYEVFKREPNIGTATIYRMVNTLEEMGVLTREKACMLVMRKGE